MQCPKCGGEMWDNRQSKTNPKAPDYKCKECGHGIWPEPRQQRPANNYPQNNYPQQGYAQQTQSAAPRPTRPAPTQDAEGKVRHGFYLEAYKKGEKLTPELVFEIGGWVQIVMTGKLPPVDIQQEQVSEEELEDLPF